MKCKNCKQTWLLKMQLFLLRESRSIILDTVNMCARTSNNDLTLHNVHEYKSAILFSLLQLYM